MRAFIKIALVLAGLVTLIAVVAAGVSAVTIDFDDVDAPVWVYDDENVTVSFTLVSDVYTWDQIEYVGLTWGPRSLGEFYNHTAGGDWVVSDDIKEDWNYTLSFPSPAGPITELHVHMFAHVKGIWGDYNEYAGPVEVKLVPVVQFAGTTGWNLVGRDHPVMVNVKNADAPEIEEVSIYWDTVTHRTDLDKANYPNRTEVITHQLLTPYYINITLPDEAANVFFLVHGLINGRDFYDVAERAVGVDAEPEFNVTAPVAAFKGTNAVVNWSLPLTSGAHTENTSVFWDTVSHAGAIDGSAYAYHSDVLAGSDLRTYEVMLTMPDELGTVYFVVHCVIKMHGYEFYTATEHTIEIIERPTVTVTEFPEAAFTGAEVHFVWTVSAPAGAVEETAIHWDTTSHAGTLDVDAYPQMSLWMIGEEDMTYDVTFEMPGTPGTLYFIAHALVLGEDFYVVEELSIVIRDMPTIEVTQFPASAFVGADVQFVWAVDAPASAVSETAIHWDTTSHAGTLDVADYPEASVWMVGEDDMTYDVTFEMPDTAGTLYFIAHAIVYDVDVYVAEELSITIRSIPTVAITDYADEGLMGEDVTITWKVTGALETDNFITMVHWDIMSHSDDPVTSNYAEHSYGIEWKEAGVYTYDLELPALKGVLYVLASADVAGTTYVDAMEVTITIKALPSVVNVTAPEKVEGGKKATVTFKLDDVEDPELVEVLWDTESHEDGDDYPNSMNATDNGDGTWSVEFKVPVKAEKVFYKVHVMDDGEHGYGTEGSFTVKEPIEDDSPGFTMLLLVLALSLIAVYVGSGRRNW